ATLVHACLRGHRQAWVEQLVLVVALFAALPLYSFVYPHSHLGVTLEQGNWLLAGVDFTLLAYAALAGAGVWYLRVRQPAPKPVARRAPAPSTDEATA